MSQILWRFWAARSKASVHFAGLSNLPFTCGSGYTEVRGTAWICHNCDFTDDAQPPVFDAHRRRYVCADSTGVVGWFARPGSTYHLLFATSNTYRPSSITSIPPPAAQFGSIAAADWVTTRDASSAALPGAQSWDGVSPLYHSVLSIAGDHARYRLSVFGPVLNLHGSQLAADYTDLFDSNLTTPVAYNEFGSLITTAQTSGQVALNWGWQRGKRAALGTIRPVQRQAEWVVRLQATIRSAVG